MLGLCCQYLEPKTKRNGSVEYINIINEQGLQYGQHLKGKYSSSQIEAVWYNNANELYKILKRVNNEGIKVFRVSSSLFPLYDALPQLLHNSSVKSVLAEAGKFALENNIRITTHPDQFVVLSSNRDDVINNSIRMLEHHSWVFDQMGLPASPYYAINIHGGVKGNCAKLVDSIYKLSANCKSRLTLENDESSYNVNDLYTVHYQTGVPIVFDTHHHVFNDGGISIDDGLKLAISTWNVKPLTHLSNTEPELVNGNFKDRRKHSYYIHYIPECQRLANNNGTIDVEVEAKGKNLSIFKMIKDFEICL
jgi:UV DNA damage endonuclease